RGRGTGRAGIEAISWVPSRLLSGFLESRGYCEPVNAPDRGRGAEQAEHEDAAEPGEHAPGVGIDAERAHRDADRAAVQRELGEAEAQDSAGGGDEQRLLGERTGDRAARVADSAQRRQLAQPVL